MNGYLSSSIFEYSQSVGTSACFGGVARTSHTAISNWICCSAAIESVATVAFLRVLRSGERVFLATAVCDTRFIGHLRAIGVAVAR